jgi:hypothetical protein
LSTRDAEPQALRQLGHQLRQAVDAMHVAAERQVAGLEQHVLGAQALDGIWVRADDHAFLRHLAQQGIQPVAAPAVLDRVAPRQNELHCAQLVPDLVGEVVVPHGGLHVHAGGGEGLEQRSEAARRGVGTITGSTVTGIEQRDRRCWRCVHGICPAGLSANGALRGLPAVDAATQVARVDTGGTQAHGRGAADFMAVHAVHDHVAVGRQFGRPGGDRGGVAPARAGDHRAGLLEHAGPTHVEDQSVADLVLAGAERLARRVHGPLVAAIDRGPVDVAHERIDVGARGSAVVHVVRMLVHVQRQDRHATGHRVGVVCGPLVDQRSLARLEHQQHPARAATQRLAHGDELFAPAFDAAEVGFQHQLRGGFHRHAIAAQAAEVQLVQQHRVGGDQFLALEAIELETGRRPNAVDDSWARIALSRLTAPP